MEESGHRRVWDWDDLPCVGDLVGALRDVPRAYDVSAVVRTSGGRELGRAYLCDLDWRDGHDDLGLLREATLTLVVTDVDVVRGGYLEDVPRWVLERVLQTGGTPDHRELLGLGPDGLPEGLPPCRGR